MQHSYTFVCVLAVMCIIQQNNAIIETGFNANTKLYRAATHKCTFTTLHVGLWNMHCLQNAGTVLVCTLQDIIRREKQL